MSDFVHVYFSPFVRESRAERAARCALGSGVAQRVAFVGYGQDELPAREINADGVEIIRLKLARLSVLPRLIRRSLQWIMWVPGVVREIKRRKPTLIQCHSLASLPACALAKIFTGARLLYDAHELETERTGWSAPQRLFSKGLERSLIGWVDLTLVVSPSICRWYRETYPGAAVELIRNIPEYANTLERDDLNLRAALGIVAEDLVFIYVGVLGEGRSVELLIDAFKRVSPDRQLVFLGDGDLLGSVKAATAKYSNIHFHQPVKPEEVVPLVTGADVGLCLIENAGLSYQFALPNKLFEYRHAGLAVITFPWGDMSDFINSNACGWLVEANVTAISSLINSLTKSQVQDTRAKAVPADSWQAESEKLARCYTELLRSIGGSKKSPK